MGDFIPIVTTPETKRLAALWDTRTKSYGFTMVHNPLLEFGAILELSLQEIGFLCVHLFHRREKKSTGQMGKIYPSLTMLANTRSIDSRPTYQRIRNSLIEKGYIAMIKWQDHYVTDIDNLVACLTFLADEHSLLMADRKRRGDDTNSRFIKTVVRKDLAKKFEMWRDDNYQTTNKEVVLSTC